MSGVGATACVVLFLASLARAEDLRPKPFRFCGGESVTIVTSEDVKEVVRQQLVSLDGYVSSSAFGTVNVLGKTLPEATSALREALQQKTGRLDPEVTVQIHSLSEVETRKEVRLAFVLGEVKTPKAVELPQGRRCRLAACLAEVGGPTENADLTTVKLLREKGDRIDVQVVDCTTFARAGQENLGPELVPGDMVIVERAPAVTVMGEVQRPGLINRQMANIEPDAPFRLSHALLAAGGVKASGDKKRIRLIRGGKDEARTAGTFALVDGVIANDPVLKGGDQIDVPIGEGVTLMGGVGSPGIYYDMGGPPLTLSRLIALAGGAAPKAKTNAVQVIRKKAPGAPLTVNLRAVMESGKLEEDVQLAPGDMVFVAVSSF